MGISAATLIRLGARYERAWQARDYGRAIELERQIETLGRESDNAVAMFVVRGRNAVRRVRGLEALHV